MWRRAVRREVARFYAYVGRNPISRLDPYGLAWQLNVGAGATGITPFFGGGFNFNVGLNIDGWNSSVYIQDQGNIGVGTGAYIGAGLNLSLAHADAPVTGFDAQKYAETDAAKLFGLGISATGNSCGSPDPGVLKGLDVKGVKPSFGYGAGAFVGYTGTATAVSPTAWQIVNAFLTSLVSAHF